MVVEYDPTKLDAKKRCTFTIVRIFTNGTVKASNCTSPIGDLNVRKIWLCRG